MAPLREGDKCVNCAKRDSQKAARDRGNLTLKLRSARRVVEDMRAFAKEVGLSDLAEVQLLEILRGRVGDDGMTGLIPSLPNGNDGSLPVVTKRMTSMTGVIPSSSPHGIIVGTPEEKRRETGVPVSNGQPLADRSPPAKPKRAKRLTVLTKAQEPGFERFWAAYPLKYKRGACETIWARYDPDDAVVDQMLATLAQQLEHLWAGDEARFIPHPKTWLNDKRWLDEVRPRPAPRPPLQAPRRKSNQEHAEEWLRMRRERREREEREQREAGTDPDAPGGFLATRRDDAGHA